MNTPAIAILVPVYNSEPYLRRVFDSILAQSFRDFTCIVGDDDSTDSSGAICEEYVSSDSRFQLVKNQKNLGWIGNVNNLLNRVEARFFMLLPHDDVLDPTYLETLIGLLESNPHAIVAYSDMKYIYQNGETEVQTFCLEDASSSAMRRCHELLQKSYWWIPYRGLVRTRLAANQVRLRKNLAGEPHADRAWVLELAMRGAFIRHPETLYIKYEYHDSVSRRWRHNRWEEIASLLSCINAVAVGPLTFLDKLQLIVLIKRKILRVIWDRFISTSRRYLNP